MTIFQPMHWNSWNGREKTLPWCQSQCKESWACPALFVGWSRRLAAPQLAYNTAPQKRPWLGVRPVGWTPCWQTEQTVPRMPACIRSSVLRILRRVLWPSLTQSSWLLVVTFWNSLYAILMFLNATFYSFWIRLIYSSAHDSNGEVYTLARPAQGVALK